MEAQNKVLFETFDRQVCLTQGRLEVHKKPGAILTLAGLAALVGAIFYLVGAGLANGWIGLGRFLQGAGGLFGTLAGLNLLIGLGMLGFPKTQVFWVLDPEHRVLRYGRNQFTFEQIETIQLAAFGEQFISLTARIKGKGPLLLLTGRPQAKAQLQGLADRCDQWLSKKASNLSTSASAPHPQDLLAHNLGRFQGLVAIGIGILWSVGGYFFFADLYFVGTRGGGGLQVPVWSAGVLILLIGIVWLVNNRE